MQFLYDLGLVVEKCGEPKLLLLVTGGTGASGGGMACRHPSHNMTWGNNESVETNLSGGRENMCGRKKFNFAGFGAGVTKSSALALRLSHISEGPDKLLIFLERLVIVFAYLLFSIPAIS